jgi:hypothetical protein
MMSDPKRLADCSPITPLARLAMNIRQPAQNGGAYWAPHNRPHRAHNPQNYWCDLRRHDWCSLIAACLDCHAEDDSMRVLIALLVIIYLVGVGVALSRD